MGVREENRDDYTTPLNPEGMPRAITDRGRPPLVFPGLQGNKLHLHLFLETDMLRVAP